MGFIYIRLLHRNTSALVRLVKSWQAKTLPTLRTRDVGSRDSSHQGPLAAPSPMIQPYYSVVPAHRTVGP
jgi:hypothetical protein